MQKPRAKCWRWENQTGGFLGLVYTNSKSLARQGIPNQSRLPWWLFVCSSQCSLINTDRLKGSGWNGSCSQFLHGKETLNRSGKPQERDGQGRCPRAGGNLAILFSSVSVCGKVMHKYHSFSLPRCISGIAFTAILLKHSVLWFSTQLY